MPAPPSFNPTFDALRAPDLPGLAAVVAADLFPPAFVPGARKIEVADFDCACVGTDMSRKFGEFDQHRRVVLLRPDVAAHLDVVRRGGPLDPGRDGAADAVNAVRTLAHELAHAASPMLKPGRGGRRGPDPDQLAAFVEEGTVELLARTFVAHAVFGAPAFDPAAFDALPPPFRPPALGTRPEEVRLVRWVVRELDWPTLADVWARPEAAERTRVLAGAVAGWLDGTLAAVGVSDPERRLATGMVPSKLATLLKGHRARMLGEGPVRVDALFGLDPATAPDGAPLAPPSAAAAWRFLHDVFGILPPSR